MGETKRADVSALLSGSRGDVTADELAELVRLANLVPPLAKACQGLRWFVTMHCDKRAPDYRHVCMDAAEALSHLE